MAPVEEQAWAAGGVMTNAATIKTAAVRNATGWSSATDTAMIFS
jgi:hypothetical protein